MQRNGLNLHLYIHIMFAPKPTLSEKELIEACQKHNRSAQRQLYERYSARMFAVCLKYARSVEVAKDYLQDGFATVFLKIGTYTGEGVFEGWMRKIFVNTALMDLRRMDVLKEAQDITETPVGAAYGNEVLENMESRELLRLITQMPIRYRTVFNLSVFEDLSHQEIAKLLGIPEATSRSYLNRGRSWLRDRIHKMNGD